MPGKRSELNIDEAIKLYDSGMTGGEVAAALNIHRRYVYEELSKRGIMRTSGDANKVRFATHGHPRYRQGMPADEIARRYGRGDSIKGIGKDYGASQALITRCLHEMGVTLRNGNETIALSARSGTEEGAAIGAKMNIVGWGEDRLRGWLRDRGEAAEAQVAVGVKNLDIAIHPIAVEILLTSSSPLALTEYRDRVKYLAERGWTTCYVLVSRRTKTLLPCVAEQLIAKAKLARADPSAPREHWVIRGCGEIAARFGDEANDRPLIPPSKCCPHHAARHPRRAD